MNSKALAFSVLGLLAAAVAASAPTQAETVSGDCMIKSVATFNNRFHVKCSFLASMMSEKGNPADKQLVPYYAVEANSALAANAVHVALAALIHKRPLTVYFDDNTSNNPAGCDKSDCRRLIALEAR